MIKTYRSIIEMTGATSTAAAAALTRSAPSRRPRFLVFHFDVVLVEAVGFVSTISPPSAPSSAARVFCVCVARPARCECDVLSPAAVSNGEAAETGAGVPSFMSEAEAATRVLHRWQRVVSGGGSGIAGCGMPNAIGAGAGGQRMRRRRAEEGPGGDWR